LSLVKKYVKDFSSKVSKHFYISLDKKKSNSTQIQLKSAEFYNNFIRGSKQVTALCVYMWGGQLNDEKSLQR